MKKFIINILLFFVFGMIGGIFSAQILWPYLIERPLFYQYKLDSGPVYVTEKKEIIIQENTALKDTIEKVEKTIIGIRAELKTGKILESTGLIISSDGLIVALSEFVPQGSEVSVFWEGEKLLFQILKRDVKTNLVLLEAKDIVLPTAPFVDLERIKLGERVFLMGLIFEKGGNFAKTVNQGIIKRFDGDFLITNIFENSNLSGSPLFDIEGNVLGINKINSNREVITISLAKIKEFAGI